MAITDKTLKKKTKFQTWSRTLSLWSRQSASVSLGFKPCPPSGSQWGALWSCRRCPWIWPRGAATTWRWSVRLLYPNRWKSNSFPGCIQINPAETESRSASPGVRAYVSPPAAASLSLWSTWCQSTRGNTCASFAPPWECFTTKVWSRCRVSPPGLFLNSSLVLPN